MAGRSEQALYLAFFVEPDRICGWHLAQAGHGHDVARDDDEELSTGRETNLANLHRVSTRCALEIGVRRERILRLRHADWIFAVARILKIAEALAHSLVAFDLARAVKLRCD